VTAKLRAKAAQTSFIDAMIFLLIISVAVLVPHSILVNQAETFEKQRISVLGDTASMVLNAVLSSTMPEAVFAGDNGTERFYNIDVETALLLVYSSNEAENENLSAFEEQVFINLCGSTPPGFKSALEVSVNGPGSVAHIGPEPPASFASAVRAYPGMDVAISVMVWEK